MKPQISASDYEKTVKFIVKYTGAGDQTPRENIQTAKWERSLKITKEGKLTNTDWQSDKEKFNDVKIPVIPGYHTDKSIIPGTSVEQKDIKIEVEYLKNGSFVPVNSQGEPIGDKKQYITDPADSSKVLMQEKLPEIPGYEAPLEKMDPYNADKDQQVFYQKIKHNLLVNVDHPNQCISANEYRRTVQFKVEFSGADEQTPAAVVQTSELTRTITADDEGKIIKDGLYTTPWKAKVSHFKDVEIPKIPGYRTKEKIIPGPRVEDQNIDLHITYEAITNKEKQNNEAKDFVQRIHFVDQQGNKLQNDQVRKLSENDRKNFSVITTPVITGYFSINKQIQVKNSEPEISVEYFSLRKIIPIDLDGNLVSESENSKENYIVKFKNDPHDPSKVSEEQIVPKVNGYHCDLMTVEPSDPSKDITVEFKADKKDSTLFIKLGQDKEKTNIDTEVSNEKPEVASAEEAPQSNEDEQEAEANSQTQPKQKEQTDNNDHQDEGEKYKLKDQVAIVNFIDIDHNGASLTSSGPLVGKPGDSINDLYSTEIPLKVIKKAGYHVVFNNFDSDGFVQRFDNNDLMTQVFSIGVSKKIKTKDELIKNKEIAIANNENRDDILSQVEALKATKDQLKKIQPTLVTKDKNDSSDTETRLLDIITALLNLVFAMGNNKK